MITPLHVPTIRFRGLCSWVLLALLLLAAPAVLGQQVRVSGSVTDKATRQAVAGASVWNLSARRGTIANDEGDFSLTARPTDTLEFRAVGYATQRFPLGGTGLSQLILQVRLEQVSVQLGGVTIREGRPDDETINRALRNVKRPAPPANAVKRPPRPKPLFPVDSAAPKAPVPTVMNPISLIYDQFSREGMQRRKMEEIELTNRIEAERNKRRAYNRYFRVNQGYEVEGDSGSVPLTMPRHLPAVPRQPVQPPAGSLAPKP